MATRATISTLNFLCGNNTPGKKVHAMTTIPTTTLRYPKEKSSITLILVGPLSQTIQIYHFPPLTTINAHKYVNQIPQSELAIYSMYQRRELDSILRTF